jgi:hypothetical protein
MKKIFDRTTNVFEEQLNDLFTEHTSKTSDKISRILSLLILDRNMSDNMVQLYDLVGIDTFLLVCSLFEKKKVEFPSREELRDLVVTAVLYYYREVKQMDWSEIKDILPFDFSPISYSFKIRNFEESMQNRMREILSGDDDE